MRSLADRVVLVTGGSRGIGREVVLQAVRAGARAVFCCRSAGAEAEDVCRAAPDPERIRYVEADVADPDAAKWLLDVAHESLGPVDVLVANAAVSIDDLCMRLSARDWDAVLDTNLIASARLARLVAPSMIERGTGNIVFVGSLAMEGAISQSSYSASKGALVGLSRALALELGPSGIACNVVLPGYVLTAMSDRLPEKMKERLTQGSPLRRPGEPREIAAAVLYLAQATPDHSNGRVLRVSGGLAEVPA